MTDIVDRLRARRCPPVMANKCRLPECTCKVQEEAAADIERLRSAEATPAMVAAALAVEPLTYAAQGPDGPWLTAELRAENMRRVIEAAREARR